MAGAITGFIFPEMFAVMGGIDVQGIYSHFSADVAASGLGSVSIQMRLVVLAITLGIISVASAGLGAAVGFLFVKFVNKLPIPSIYFKALGFGVLIFVLVSLPRIILGSPLDIYLLAALVGSSVIFSLLFIRWTKKTSSPSQPTIIDNKTEPT